MRKLSRRSLMTGGAVTLAAAGGGTYTIYRLFAQTAAASVMSPPEVLDAVRQGDVLLVDVRQPEEWQKTGIAEGAVPIDLRRDDFIDAVLAVRAFEKQPIAVICAGGVRSRRMTLWLDEAGISPIIDIPEGMLGSSVGPGWLARGLPVQVWNG